MFFTSPPRALLLTQEGKESNRRMIECCLKRRNADYSILREDDDGNFKVVICEANRENAGPFNFGELVSRHLAAGAYVIVYSANIEDPLSVPVAQALYHQLGHYSFKESVFERICFSSGPTQGVAHFFEEEERRSRGESSLDRSSFDESAVSLQSVFLWQHVVEMVVPRRSPPFCLLSSGSGRFSSMGSGTEVCLSLPGQVPESGLAASGVCTEVSRASLSSLKKAEGGVAMCDLASPSSGSTKSTQAMGGSPPFLAGQAAPLTGIASPVSAAAPFLASGGEASNPNPPALIVPPPTTFFTTLCQGVRQVTGWCCGRR